MGSDVRHVRGEAQKELVKKFEVFSSNGRSRWQVWSDWITMSAIAVSNATDRSHFDEREKQYLSIAGKYTRPEMEAFTEMLALLVVALEDNPEQDFLGELYMCLGLGNDHAGQFFTPYHLCEFMSAVTTPAEEFQQKIGDRGWVAVCDPTCGAGALLVAFANECRKKGINYQTDVLFVAQDIDYIVGMMCYLQMSLLGMPGYVVIGDVDTMEDVKGLPTSKSTGSSYKVKKFAKPASQAYCIEMAAQYVLDGNDEWRLLYAIRDDVADAILKNVEEIKQIVANTSASEQAAARSASAANASAIAASKSERISTENASSAAASERASRDSALDARAAEGNTLNYMNRTADIANQVAGSAASINFAFGPDVDGRFSFFVRRSS